MAWEPLRLTERTAGSEYGENTLRVAELLEKMSAGPGRADRPAVVWIHDPADDRSNSDCESKVFANESVGLALRMFRTYRVNLEDIPSETIREEYARTVPAFHFFDPAGRELAVLSGRKASSLSTFTDYLERTWSASFSASFRDYAKEMKKVLDRLDKLDGRKQVLARDRANLAGRSNPRKERELARDEEELAREEEAILEEEREIQARVELRPEYRPDESVDAR